MVTLNAGGTRYEHDSDGFVLKGEDPSRYDRRPRLRLSPSLLHIKNPYDPKIQGRIGMPRLQLNTVLQERISSRHKKRIVPEEPKEREVKIVEIKDDVQNPPRISQKLMFPEEVIEFNPFLGKRCEIMTSSISKRPHASKTASSSYQHQKLQRSDRSPSMNHQVCNLNKEQDHQSSVTKAKMDSLNRLLGLLSKQKPKQSQTIHHKQSSAVILIPN